MTRGVNGKYLSNVSAAAPPVAVGVIALQVALDAAVQQKLSPETWCTTASSTGVS